ncbi:MAG: cadherin-like domain-containing protein, partial [Magnetospirillum sp.]|nr:cadherin-like domain-containing protein [Magnetospirillum sp.]
PPPPPPVSAPPPPPNHDPTASDVTLPSGVAGVSVTINKSDLLANARDQDGDTLSVKAGSISADHGTVVDHGSSITFTPTAGYSGTDTLTYVIEDGKGGSVTAHAIANEVLPANIAPTVAGTTNATSTDHTGGVTGHINASDVDANDAGLVTYHLQGGSVLDGTHDFKLTTHGTVTIDTTTGDFTFTPSAAAASLGSGVTVTDTANVVVADGHGGSVITGVAVDITGSNDAPINSGAVTLASGVLNTASTISIASLLAQTSDVDTGDSLTLSTISVDHGTVTISGSDVIFTPDTGYTGAENFSYTITDGHGGSAAGSASMTVLTNHAPVSSGTATVQTLAEDLSTNMDGTWLKSLFLANATDADGDSLTVTNITANHGTISVLGDGSYTFNPDQDFNGTVTLTATIDDGHGGTTTGLAEMIYTPVNDAPTVSGGPVTLTSGVKNVASTISFASLLGHATDVDGDTMIVTSVSVDHGTATISGSNVLFTPDTNFTGTETFTYTIDDQNGGTVGGSATMAVNSLLSQSGTVLHSTAASVLTDANFSGFSGADTLVFDIAAGTQGVTLGSVTSAMGLTIIDGSATTGTLTVNGGSATANLTITGGIGKDIMTGGTGADTFTGGVGADSLTGGGGADLFVYTGAADSQDNMATARDVITDFATGTDHIAISLSGTHVDVSGFSSVAGYNAGQATLALGGVVGDGFYSSGDQALYIYDQGASTAIGSGYVIGSANTIVASDLNFSITGTSGADTLVGGAGSDVITGGAGNDRIAGGAGSDVAGFSGLPSNYTFSAGNGTLTVSGTDGTDTVTGIETLRFSGGDLTVSGGVVNAEAQANTYTTLDQKFAKVTTLSDGGYVVAWQSNGQDGDTWGIYGQVYNANGTARGSEFRLSNYTAGEETDVSLAATNDGGFVATWEQWGSGGGGQDGSYGGVFARHFDSSGTALTGDTQVNVVTVMDQYDAKVTALSNGGYVVTYKVDDANYSGVWARVYNSSDSATTTEIQVNQYTNQHQFESDSAQGSDGKILIVWQSDTQDTLDGSRGVYGRLMNTDGTFPGNEFRINTTQAGDQFAPAIAALDSGYVVVWTTENLDGSGYAVAGQRYDNAGTAQGSEFQVNSTTAGNQSTAQVVKLSGGNFAVVWQDSAKDGSGDGIVGRIFDASGNAVSDEILVNTVTAGNQQSPAISATNDGGFVVAWQSDGQDGNLNGIFTRHFSADGSGATPVVLTGTGAADSFTVGLGIDSVIMGNGNDVLQVGAGSHSIDGGAGTDTVSYAPLASGITASVTGSSATVVHGGTSDTITNVEVLTGTSHNDSFSADGSAAVTVNGGGGADAFTLTGLPSADLVLDGTGGTGTLSMNITGRSAESVVRDMSWNGSDMVLTMQGGHTVTIVNDTVDTLLSPSGHTEKVVATGGAVTGGQDYMVVGKAGDTTLTGNTGDDTLVWVSGVTTMDGTGTGHDTVDFHKASGDIVADMLFGTVTIGGTETVTLSSIMTGIHGGSGNDTLVAGYGNTWLEGGDGNNFLDGTVGGAGGVVASYQDQLAGVTIDLYNSTAYHGAGHDFLFNIKAVMGSDFADTITGSLVNDTVYGSAGGDTINGSGGVNTLDYSHAGSGVSVDLDAGTASNGFGGTDHISNFTVIKGSDFADTLNGGVGSSTLTGGSGADTFVLHDGGSTSTTITDFGTGSDSFKLSDAEFHLGTSGTLTTGANYAEGSTTMSGTSQNFGSGTDGIVAIDNGGHVELWHTTNMGAATNANSHQVGTLEGVNTSALDNTSFHLAV